MAWGTFTESDFLTLDNNFEAFISASDPLIIALNPREKVDFVFTVDVAGTPTDDVEIQILGGHQISTGNTLDGVTGVSDVELDTAADGFSTDDDMNGVYIAMITSGSARGDLRLITDSVAADDGIVPSHAFTSGIAASDPYALYRLSILQSFLVGAATASETEPNTAGTSVLGWPYVAILCRADGATDAHRVRVSCRQDGVSA